MSGFEPQAGWISAIVPTIGRPESLRRLLESLTHQSKIPGEVIVADGSTNREVERVVDSPTWLDRGLTVRRISVQPPNAVRQRQLAIQESRGEYLLMLDDDVVLEPACVEEMLRGITSNTDVVAVGADFNNQTWAGPTRVWRWYLRWCCGLREGGWQGRVIGPLLRFGYNPTPQRPVAMEWLGAGMSLIRRRAYEQVGGFSGFFLHRCTMNEDVDLGIKLSRAGRILFCPAARMGHFHASGGRVSPMQSAEDDLYNRYLVMHQTQGRSGLRSFGLVLLYFSVETLSNAAGCFRRLETKGFGSRTLGRLSGLCRILLGTRLGKVNG